MAKIEDSQTPKQRYRAAQVELIRLLTEIERTKTLPRDPMISSETDAILHIKRQYDARLTTGSLIANQAENVAAAVEDLRQALRNITALLDDVAATGATTRDQVDVERAVTRYNLRYNTLRLFQDRTEKLSNPELDGNLIGPGKRPPLESLRGKSATELLRVITRVIPTDQTVDRDITDLFVAILEGARFDPGLEGGRHAQELEYGILWDMAGTQDFREYLGAYASELIEAVLKSQHVEAYDECFRNTYFSAISYLLRYLRTHPAPKSVPSKTAPIPARPPQEINQGKPMTIQKKTSPRERYITENEAELVTLKDSDAAATHPAGSAAIKGTGLD